MERIILASGSPRRKDILTRLKIPFKAVTPQIKEGRYTKDTARENVKKLALEKAINVLSQLNEEECHWILGFDTLIELNGNIIGKPSSEKNARSILKLLSGNIHRVYTGIALIPHKESKIDVRCAKSKVKFAGLRDTEIDYYISTGEWKGAAGAYRIQERGAFFIEWIKGSYSNIVGLPISLFYGMLVKNNYSFSLR